MFTPSSWFLSEKKRKACLIIGSAYVKMHRILKENYGIGVPKPKVTEFCLEISKVGVHYHILEYLSSTKYNRILVDFQERYPESLYELDIIIVLSRHHFMSKKLLKVLPKQTNVALYVDRNGTVEVVNNVHDVDDIYVSDNKTVENEDETDTVENEYCDGTEHYDETQSLLG